MCADVDRVRVVVRRRYGLRLRVRLRLANVVIIVVVMVVMPAVAVMVVAVVVPVVSGKEFCVNVRAETVSGGLTAAVRVAECGRLRQQHTR